MSNLFFDNIKNINWFSNCGNKFVAKDFPIQIEFLQSLGVMMNSLISDDWQSAILEARNRLTVFLHQREKKHYSDWNKITEKHKANLVDVDDIAGAFADKNKLDKNFVDTIRWNILAASMEDYYFSINKEIPIFFKYLIDIYARGNVPCGIKGEIEESLNVSQVDFSKFTLLVY